MRAACPPAYLPPARGGVGYSATVPVKTAYLLSHRNRLANQLWNLIAIRAFCIERGYELQDCAAFDYHAELGSPGPSFAVEAFLRAFDALAPVLLSPVLTRTRVVRYGWWKALEALRKVPSRLAAPPPTAPVLDANGAFYLPPSECTDPAQRALLDEAERRGSVCFRGWLFKNPVGIRTHRAAVLASIAPRAPLAAKVAAFVERHRARHARLVGVHLRQGDYKTWLGGKLYISEREARRALDELLRRRGWRADETLFVVCSDGPLDLSAFAGLAAVRGPGSPIDDLLTLASCDLLVGSNSTFGGFASYYGDVPLIVLQRGGLNWDYYADKTGYFEDEHFMCNLLQGSRESPRGDGSFFRAP
jgi:hypothetical protein